MKNQVNFSKNAPQDFDDLGGKHQAAYAGKCVVCGARVYSERDYHGDTLGPVYDPDCRGTIGYYHSVKSLVASEFGKAGDDVLICTSCADISERYARAVYLALAQWGAL